MTAHKRIPLLFLTAVVLLSTVVWLTRREEARTPVTVATRTIPAIHSTPTPDPLPAPRAIPIRHEEPAVADGFRASANGAYDVQRPNYSASVTNDGALHYRAAQSSKTELQLQLRCVRSGNAELFARSEIWSPLHLDHEGAVTIHHTDNIQERYTPRFDGVEQSFTIAQVPNRTADLAFVCDVTNKNLIPIAARANRGGGILFMDESGVSPVRYGKIVVRDAAGKGLAVEPRLDTASATIRFEVPGAWLSTAALPLFVDPLVGADFVVSPDNPNGVAPPTIAAGVNNYLIVWDDFTLGATAPTLAAAVVTSSGIVSPAIVLSSNTTAPRPYRFQRTEVAFDGTNWLVVWSADGGTGAAIHGCLVSSGGGTNNTNPAGTLLNGGDFQIATTTGTVEEDPLVTFNGTDYVVVWHSGPPGSPAATSGSTTSTGSQIFYTRVSTGGIVATPGTITSLFAKPSQSAYFIAGQKPAGDTLLVYSENNETPPAIRGARIAQDGTLRDPGGFSIFKSNQKDNGFGQPIGVAFIGTDWNVLSSYDQTTDGAVFLHHVSTSGTVTPPTGVFAVMGLGPTGSTLDKFEPAFAGTSSWLFVRNEKVSTTVYHILGKRVGFDGTDQDPIPFQIDTATQGILRSAVAAQGGTQFLVSWLDGRKGTPQPADAKNIAAAFVDAVAADTNGPALVPNLAASPTTGSKPLAVSFDASQSSGSYDTLQWTFGDGSTSTSATVSHTYLNNGTYTAQLTLIKGAYQVSRTVTIFVGGSAGSEPTQIGVPVQSTDGIIPNLFINTMQVALDFQTSRDDSITITGTVDPEFVPASPTGTTCSITVGASTHQFALDSKGTFTSDASQPTAIKFSVKPSTGTFNYTASKDDLVSSFDLFGAQNTTVSPAVLVTVPVTISINSLTATASVSIAYTAKLNQKGVGSYAFQKKGKPVSGSFVISGFSAAESSGTHNYAIKGVLALPNGALLTPSTTGNFVFELGNYSTTIPGAQLLVKGSSVKFAAPKGTTAGIKSFTLNTKSGAFTLSLIAIPSADPTNGSGLPLSTGNSIVNVDLNLSFQFDLSSGHIDAGRYIYIFRANANAKTWKLRDFQ